MHGFNVMDSLRKNWLLIVGLLVLTLHSVTFSPAYAAEDKTQNTEAVDWTEIAYRKAKILGGHANLEEALGLVNQLISLGHLETAREILEKGPQSTPEYRLQYLDSFLALEKAIYFKLDYNNPAKEQQKGILQNLLQEISAEEQIDVNELLRYLKISEQLNLPSAIIILSKKLAEKDPENQAKWWNTAGQWSKAEGLYSEAIEYFHKAVQSAKNEVERGFYRFDWLRALHTDGQKQLLDAELSRATTDKMLDSDNLKQLAEFCLAIERPDFAWQFFGLLMESDQSDLKKWQEETVRWALAAGQPLEAAEFFGQMASKDIPLQRKDDFLRIQLELLLQANRSRDAFEVIALLVEHRPKDENVLEQAVKLAMATENIANADTWNRALLKIHPDNPTLLQRQLDLALAQNKAKEALQLTKSLIHLFPEKREFLETGVNLALSVEEFDTAATWNNKLLQMNPEDSQVLKKQAEISMARENVGEAVESLRRLFKQNPEDNTIRWKLAELEEWSGHPRVALEHWLYLSKTTSDPGIYEQIYRLSRMLNEYSIALKALDAFESLRPLTVEEIKDRIQLYEIIGDPDQAVTKTKSYLKNHPQDYQIWMQLAHLQMRAHDYRQALKTWEKVASLFGRNKEETLLRSECYWRLGDKNRALEVMESYEGELTPLDNLYHARLLVGLGWRYRRPELAKQSFASLIKYYDEKQFVSLERLIYLQRDAGNVKDAIQIAIQSAEETKDQRFLLLALNLVAASLKENEEEWLLEKLENSLDDFESIPLYWIIKAQKKYSQGEYQEAEELYKRALAVDIESPNAQEGILWSLLSQGNKEELAKQLDSWQANAIKHKELWLVYAVSRQNLGQLRQACSWYERLLMGGSDDYGIILGYADVLDALGVNDRAYRLRMYAMMQLREDAAASLSEKNSLTAQLKAYINLVFQYGTAPQREYWLQTLQQMDSVKEPSQWIYEVAISWYLNSKQQEKARLWLANAHKQRLKMPYWQELLLALENNDKEKLATILENNAEIDLENKVAILGKLNRYQEALDLAVRGIADDRSYRERSKAALLAAGIKGYFPAYVDGGYETTFSDQLDTRQVAFSGMYSLEESPIGVEARYHHVEFESSVYKLRGNDKSDDLVITAYYLGQANRSGAVELGVNKHPGDDIAYGGFRYQQRFSDNLVGKLALAVNGIPDVDSILQTSTLQNRLDATVIGSVAGNYYYYMDVWARDYITRSKNDVAKGYGATAELGFKQHYGRFEWLIGLQGNFEQNYDRQLPNDLKVFLPPEYTIDDVIAEEGSSVLVGGRVGRGGIREAYPTAASFRYFLSAWAGDTWPQNELAVYLKAGAGFRILGNDELSLQLHYNQSGGVVGQNDDSGLAIQYKYYF